MFDQLTIDSMLDDRLAECLAAKNHCEVFMTVNEIEYPIFEFLTTSNPRRYGVYNLAIQRVRVFANNCHGPSGFWEDLSILGVTAHEVGHHIENKRGWGDSVYGSYHHVWMTERPMSRNSQMDRHEDLADALVLFMVNPSLLLALCPQRFAFIHDELRLMETEHRSWREVLSEREDLIRNVEERL